MRSAVTTTPLKHAVAAAVLALAAGGMSPAVAQQLVLQPVDQAARNPEFAAWRKALLDAVRRRDTERVVAQAAPDIKLSFGDAYGRETFRQALTGAESWQGEAYWRELETVLALGGLFMEDGAFCTPYLSCMDVPGCPDCDPYETVFVVTRDAPARSRPGETAAVVARLSYAVLPLDLDVQSGEDWYPVRLPGGRTAFLSHDHARTAIDYRARIEKTGEGWRITVFLAGD